MQCTELSKGKGYSFVERRYTKVGVRILSKMAGGRGLDIGAEARRTKLR